MPRRDPSSPQRVSTSEPDVPPHATAASLRRGLWNHLLVYPPLVSAICGLARARLDPSRRADAFLVRLLGGPSPCPREPLPARPPPSREQLASALLALDPGGTLLDAIVADLISLEAGVATGLSLRLHTPPRASRGFRLYTARVRSRYAALCVARSAA